MFFGVGAVGRQSIVGKRGVQGATLDLGFMSPGVLDPRITFTRASTATYFDATGTMQTAAINAPRWDYTPGTPATNNTWNPGDLTNVTLSLANLRASGTNSTSGVRGSNGRSSGKYYIEQTYTTLNTNSITCGIALASASLTTPGAGTSIVARLNGTINVNGIGTGSTLGTIPASAVIGIAVDFTAQLIWYRIAPAGSWNGSGTADPVAGTGGISISIISTGALYPLMSSGTSDVMTANFGGSAFIGAVPSGFTAGWPVSAGTPSTLNGLLIESSRTNLLLNSAALSTQSVTVSAQPYTLSFYGTGTVTKSGAATGALVGTGAFPQRVTQVFTPTAGTLTLTVTGSVVNAQLETDTFGQGSFASSYIPTTGATVARAADVFSMPVSTWFNQTRGSTAFEYIIEGAPINFGAPMGFIGANVDTDYIDIDEITTTGGSGAAPTLSTSTVSVGGTVNTTAFFTQVPMPAGLLQKGAAAWNLNGQIIAAHNAIACASSNGSATALPVITGLSIAGQIHFQQPLCLWARRVRYWPRTLTSAELLSVTT